MAQLLAGTLIGGLHVLNEVDALVRYGTSNNFTLATLNTALAAIGGDTVTLLLRPGTWTVTDNLTIPANVTLKLPKGCLLTVTALKTLTINGTVEAGPYQVFGGAGTATVTNLPREQAWWGSAQRLDVTTLTASGNITAASGTISAGTLVSTGNITAAAGTISGATLISTGNITASSGTISGATLTSSGNITAASGTISGLTLVSTGGTITANSATIVCGTTITFKNTAADGAAAQFYFQNASAQNLAIIWHSDASAPSETPDTHGRLSSGKIYNAVYNDIADFLELEHKLKIEFGRVYVMKGREVTLSTQYCQVGIIGIASDTYGFGVGVKKNSIPISVAGYVLACVDRVYVPGTPLTSDKNGKLTRMTRVSCKNYPERIIATFLREELNPIWNGIEVRKRHWVKVK